MGQTVKRRIVGGALALLQFVSVIAIGQLVTMLPARAAFACNAGTDGGGGTLAGTTTDTYMQPGLGTISAGSTSVPLGTIDTNGGGGGSGGSNGSTAVAAGDLLLIIQMQDGTFT